MGCFTTIIDDQNRQWQIKCGRDICQTYRVGEEITDWHVAENCPGEGYLLDGIYKTNSYDDDNIHVLIGIKNHIVSEIIELPKTTEGDYNYDEGSEYDRAYTAFHQKYSFTPPREWWSEELWQKKEVRDEEHQEENDLFIKGLDAMNLTPKERLAMMMVRPLRRTLNLKSLFREVFQITPLHEMDIRNNAT